MSKSQANNLSLWNTFKQADSSGKIALILSTWFGIGLLPGIPGTFGTLAAVPLMLVLSRLTILQKTIALVIIVIVAIWSSGHVQDILGKKDPPEVVIDEVAGFALTMFFLSSTWLTFVLGFTLFRFFDILKPFPIRHLEKIRTGFGIVFDDLLAGLYAFAGVEIILILLR